MSPPSMDPTCRLCGAPVASGDVVVFDHGELTHIHCHEQRAGDLADRIVAFLASHPAENVCHTCLSAALASPRELVQKAVVRLRISAEVAVCVGACARCQQPRVTLRARLLGRSRERQEE